MIAPHFKTPSQCQELPEFSAVGGNQEWTDPVPLILLSPPVSDSKPLFSCVGNGALRCPSESQVRCGNENAEHGSRLGSWLTLWPQNHFSLFTLTGTVASRSISQVGVERLTSVTAMPWWWRSSSLPTAGVTREHMCSTEHWKLGQDP